ncbi:L-lactate permease, partial [Anoxybacillus sp. KU2-6(11)]|uniref:L-lactate permease n=1 Tax=Anoxybacillus sp. KU2-6(11) TaxID=1535751 RepID=UPI000508BFFF
FPSMIGGLIGLAIVIPAAKRIFITEEPWDFKKTDAHEQVTNVQSDMPLLLAWMPYILVALILVLTRLQNLPLKAWLRSVKLQFNNILGTNISTSIEPLYLPGTILLLYNIFVASFYA